MQPEPNTQPPENKRFKNSISQLWEGIGSLGDFLDEVWVKVNNLTETNYQFGCKMAAEGRLTDAILRFKVTLWLAPTHVPSLYNLGCIYHHKKQDDKALEYFHRALQLQPNHEDALYMVASINPAILKPGMRPVTTPRNVTETYFDALARSYDSTEQQKNYQLPAILHQLLRAEMDGSKTGTHDLLDLGCGTGLCGAQFREEFANIVGVDIANAMLDIAYRRMDRRGIKIYTRLIHNDLRLQLQDIDPATFDVALCIQTFQSLGDLTSTFQGVSRILRDHGLFACSFDDAPQAEDFQIIPPDGLFAHSLDYVLSQAKAAGLEAVRTGEVPIYPNQHVQLCIFRKRATHANTDDTASNV